MAKQIERYDRFYYPSENGIQEIEIPIIEKERMEKRIGQYTLINELMPSLSNHSLLEIKVVAKI